MSDVPALYDGSRRAAGAAAALLAACAIAAPNAREAWGGLAPGDATLALRFVLIASAAMAACGALYGMRWRAAGAAASVLAPALAFVPGFPSALAPFALAPFYAALARAASKREAAWLAVFAAECQLLGAAGWIFHYFRSPWLPSAIAFAIAVGLWAPLGAATRALVSRSAAWIPVAASLIPLTEWIRGVWMQPPLPGLTFAHASAGAPLALAAAWIGETGVSWCVAAAGAALGIAWTRTRRTGFIATGAVALAIAGSLLVTGASSRDSADGATTRVCAVRDPTRTEGRPAFGGGGATALTALIAHGEQLGCELIAFPEYSIELAPSALLPDDWGLDRLAREPAVIGGAYVQYEQASEPRRYLRNVVCRLHVGPGRQVSCAGARDKLVFAPFGEASLFQDLPWLARAGAWASLQAMGRKFTPLRSIEPRGVVAIGPQGRAGVAICWEILVPEIFERRGVAGRGAVNVLVVVSDLDGFGGSLAAIDHFRRAAAMHAISLDAPLLFASTHSPFLLDARGKSLPPRREESFFVVWDVPIGGGRAALDSANRVRDMMGPSATWGENE